MPRISLFSLLIALLLVRCSARKEVDLLVLNAHICSVDGAMHTYEAMAISNGKIVALGDEHLGEQYAAKEILDLEGRYVYPGFNDAHSHFYGLGLFAQRIDLTGTDSWGAVIQRCGEFAEGKTLSSLQGRGWDQNDWETKTYPDNTLLNQLFPDIPVLLKRVDGHAAIANQKALALAHVDAKTSVEGGSIILKDGKPTGVLIDNAVDLVGGVMPKPSREEMIQALLDAQQQCFDVGLSSVCDAGLSSDIVSLIDSLQTAGKLSIRVYAMLDATDQQLDDWLKREPIRKPLLNVSSFKLYADGSLGSRGACLLEPYADERGHSGFLLTPLPKIGEYINRVAASKYQLNTHCIGDSANRLVLKLYAAALGKNNNRRWRIEDAQVISPGDFQRFKDFGIVPSVQPTHATSDMYWAEDRLGKLRVKGAYAYRDLLRQNGWLPLGTDFPVESTNPLYTFYAAVSRQDDKGFPTKGFQPEQALSREEALKGITYWPAMASFEEGEKGSLEPGKYADFVVLDHNLLTADLLQIRNSKIHALYVQGVRVK